MDCVHQSVGTVDPRVLFQRGGTTLQQISCSPCESEKSEKSDLVEGQGQSRFVTPEIGKPTAEAGQRGGGSRAFVRAANGCQATFLARATAKKVILV